MIRRVYRKEVALNRDEETLRRNTAVVDALCELFRERPEGVSMIVIARKAGLSLPEVTRSLEFLQRNDLVEPVSRGFVPILNGRDRHDAKVR